MPSNRRMHVIGVMIGEDPTALWESTPWKYRIRGSRASETSTSRAIAHVKNGQLCGLLWHGYDKLGELETAARELGGRFDEDMTLWTFPTAACTKEMLGIIQSKHPDWDTLADDGSGLDPWILTDTSYCLTALPHGDAALAVTLPLPKRANTKKFLFFKKDPVHGDLHKWILHVKDLDGPAERPVLIAIGKLELVHAAAALLAAQGAQLSPTLFDDLGLTTRPAPVSITVSGWSVRINCDIHCVQHFRLRRTEESVEWQSTQDGPALRLIEWRGQIHSTRKTWTDLRGEIELAGLSWVGDDPAAALSKPAEVAYTVVPGWNAPAQNGFFLHEYQKEGVEFAASRGMRALIGDEMGVGKTAQAIASAEACEAARIIIVCPANARYVWDREVRGWSTGGWIQHIQDQLDSVSPDARWHIVTYDQLVSRTETWRIRDEQEEEVLRSAISDDDGIFETGAGGQRTLKLRHPTKSIPAFADTARLKAWQRMTKRLSGSLLAQLLTLDPSSALLIVDEAHRVKNQASKRTKAVALLSSIYRRSLLLTGTPLRNNEHEAAVLLGLLDSDAKAALDNSKGYTIEDVKDYLTYFMIRRLKRDVLEELPPKTRSRVDINQLDENALEDYRNALDGAREIYRKALADGCGEWDARCAAIGLIEIARSDLGRAKVLGGAVADLVSNVVENTGCCVVFSAHHDVSDLLAAQLKRAGHTIVVVDGRTAQRDRARYVEEFQQGTIDVFIGGINAAGEAITLTRSETVVFVELDWVPAALMQAEDRIHRVGQEAQNCQIMHVIAKLDGDNLDEQMVNLLGRKLERIGQVLDENADHLVAQGSVQTAIANQILGISSTTAASQSVLCSVGTSDDEDEELAMTRDISQ